MLMSYFFIVVPQESIGENKELVNAMSNIIDDLRNNVDPAKMAAMGIDIDMLGLLKNLTDAEAAKLLARQMANNQAQLDMMRKLQARKNGKLTAEQQAELDALMAADEAYRRMMEELEKNGKSKLSFLSDEEKRAQEEFWKKLQNKKKPIKAPTPLPEEPVPIDTTPSVPDVPIERPAEPSTGPMADEIKSELGKTLMLIYAFVFASFSLTNPCTGVYLNRASTH
jgi:hypothetical protein